MINVNDLESYISQKVLPLEEINDIITKLKNTNKTVGLCHGGFDLLHPGHVKHFESAKSLCDVLIISITADEFVNSRKGSGRPIYTDKLRAFIVSNISFVDYVVITDFKLGVDVINSLKPSFYIKGPDFINKKTPGITAERESIIKVGGEMKYTTEPPMSTTKIIDYIKNVVDIKSILLIIDRDGTIINNDDYPGKNDKWKEELVFNNSVINFISFLQTKYKLTNIVVSNQAGVAKGLFDIDRVEEVNTYIDEELNKRGIKIDDWQYCPDCEKKYAQKTNEFNFNQSFIKEKTKRKPSTIMVTNSLKKLQKDIKKFTNILVLGDRFEDEELAKNLNALFINVTNKKYEELQKELNSFTN